MIYCRKTDSGPYVKASLHSALITGIPTGTIRTNLPISLSILHLLISLLLVLGLIIIS